MKLRKNHLLLSLKLIIIAIAFVVVMKEADLEKIGGYLKQINPLYLLFAYIALVSAQLVSALRTRFYYARAGLNLNKKFSIGLYFTGMFLNTILPGGIGGDGYKIYTLKKLADFSKMKSLRLLVSDRASGLFVLLVFSIVALFYSDFMQIVPHAKYILIIASLGLLPSYLISIKILLKELPKTAAVAAIYSLFVQGFGVLAISSILLGLGFEAGFDVQFAGYISLFLLSSVLAILPISIGGIGIREVSFLYGASLLGLNAEMGVAVALVYFAVNLICSLNGLFFWHNLQKMYLVNK